jgi:uncharacterized protein with HEPN domain
MAHHDASVTLRQLTDALERALKLLGGLSAEEFTADEMRHLAVARLLEIAGEAVTRLPPDVREAHPEIPWREMVGLRNILIHAYDRVDLLVVHQILTGEVPAVLHELRRVIALLSSD